MHERDRMMTATLAPLGLEKGKPFAPAEREKRLIADSAFMSMNISYDKRFPDWSYRKDANGPTWFSWTPNTTLNSMNAPITYTGGHHGAREVRGRSFEIGAAAFVSKLAHGDLLSAIRGLCVDRG